MERFAKVTAGTYHLTVPTADRDGNAVTSTGTPTVSIADGGGTVVHTMNATPVAGSLSADVPCANLAALDMYTATWSGTVATVAQQWRSYVELASDYLFNLGDLRAMEPSLADTSRYTGAMCRAARTAAEQRFERAAKVAYVPRGRLLSVFGDGRGRLELADNVIRRVVSVSIDGVALTAGELAALTVREWGALDRPSGFYWEDGAAVSVYYEHGYDYPPEPVRQAAMVLAREYLVRSPLSSRATVEQTDVGFFRLSIAGGEKWTGIPDVDAAIEQFGRRRPNIG